MKFDPKIHTSLEVQLLKEIEHKAEITIKEVYGNDIGETVYEICLTDSKNLTEPVFLELVVDPDGSGSVSYGHGDQIPPEEKEYDGDVHEMMRTYREETRGLFKTDESAESKEPIADVDSYVNLWEESSSDK